MISQPKTGRWRINQPTNTMNSKCHKKTKKTPTFCFIYLHHLLIKNKMKITIHPETFLEWTRALFFKYVDYWMIYMHHESISFSSYPPKYYLSLGRALKFHIGIGMHPNKMVNKLSCKMLYPE